jgi:hypothetical protein
VRQGLRGPRNEHERHSNYRNLYQSNSGVILWNGVWICGYIGDIGDFWYRVWICGIFRIFRNFRGWIVRYVRDERHFRGGIFRDFGNKRIKGSGWSCGKPRDVRDVRNVSTWGYFRERLR